MDPIAWGSVTMTTERTMIDLLIGYSASQCGESDRKYGKRRESVDEVIWRCVDHVWIKRKEKKVFDNEH